MSKRKTKKADRMNLYLELINQLCIAEICCNNKKFFSIGQEITALHRKFEREDDNI